MSGHTTETKDGEFFGTQDAFIQELNLVFKNGTKFPLKRFLVEFCYFEDLYSFSVSGYITLRDGVGLIENHRITGKEEIEVIFGKSKSNDAKALKLRLYKVGTRTPTGNMTSEFYKLYFCSEELMLSQQSKISKSYKGKSISDIVQNILVDKLKVNDSQLYAIEPTVGVYDFIVPNLRPFEAISWLSTYARPTSTDLVGADMLLFQNKDGFNFRSLTTMMKQQPVRKYKYQQNNLPTDTEKELVSVLNYEVVKSSDTLKEVTDGLYANRVIAVDPLRRRYEVYDFNYDSYKSSVEPMNGQGIPTNYQNKDGKLPTEAYESCVRMVYSTSQQSEVNDIKSKNGSVTKDMFETAVLSHRSAQLSLANHTVVKLMVPGDPLIKVGQTIEFNIRSILPDDNRPADGILSGKYLVTAVRHVLQSQGVYQTILEIAKNGSIAKTE